MDFAGFPGDAAGKALDEAIMLLDKYGPDGAVLMAGGLISWCV